ncbi:ArnT family glycosyltransferase [Pseudomonas oryzihabitans]|uniref:ArnT family glycosyltransferase n=1 Tax=Pseudomonas oryzihabitans TaxID=47885 RepID=UPI0028945A3A|nr:glycosyltransferase family 39 protein [Pseudomonas oryzihabitans]MDT3722595.1 glycosyltransferase family 39 protein [Pseudomonas oryzihabitans]
MSSIPSPARLRLESLALCLLAVPLFTLGLWEQPFIGFDGRFALFAQEMFRHGVSAFPTSYGQPYPDYPATSTLFINVIAHLFGEVNRLATVIPTALASAAIVGLLYRLLASHSRRWALLAVLVLLLTNGFLAKARSICLDQFVTLAALGCFYLLWSADQRGLPRRRALVFLCLAAGFAVRGPLGLIEPCGVVCVYWLLQGDWRRSLGYGLVGALLLALCCAVLFGLAWHTGGVPFVEDVIRMQVSGRLDDTDGAGYPWWYFLQLGLYRYAPAFPLALLALPTLRRHWLLRQQQVESRLLVQLAGFAVLIVVALSIPTFKKPYYILPAIPACAALGAWVLLQGQGVLAWVRRLFLPLLVLFPVVLGVLVKLQQPKLQAAGWWPPLDLRLLLAGFGILALFALLAAWRERGAFQVGMPLAAAALAQWLLVVLALDPMQALRYDTRAFVTRLESLRQGEPGQLVFFGLGQDTKAFRYLMNLDYDVPMPVFIDVGQPGQLAHVARPAYVLLDADSQAALAGTPLAGRQPVLDGRFNDNRWQAYYLP